MSFSYVGAALRRRVQHVQRDRQLHHRARPHLPVQIRRPPGESQLISAHHEFAPPAPRNDTGEFDPPHMKFTCGIWAVAEFTMGRNQLGPG